MEEKENDSNSQFLKGDDDKTQQYILQKNTKTKKAILIISIFLAILMVGLIISGIFFGEGV